MTLRDATSDVTAGGSPGRSLETGPPAACWQLFALFGPTAFRASRPGARRRLPGTRCPRLPWRRRDWRRGPSRAPKPSRPPGRSIRPRSAASGRRRSRTSCTEPWRFSSFSGTCRWEAALRGFGATLEGPGVSVFGITDFSFGWTPTGRFVPLDFAFSIALTSRR